MNDTLLKIGLAVGVIVLFVGVIWAIAHLCVTLQILEEERRKGNHESD